MKPVKDLTSFKTCHVATVLDLVVDIVALLAAKFAFVFKLAAAVCFGRVDEEVAASIRCATPCATFFPCYLFSVQLFACEWVTTYKHVLSFHCGKL